MQILAKQIIFDNGNEIVEHESNSRFVYFRSLVQGLSTPENGKGSSEHVPLGAQKSDKASQNSENVEELWLVCVLQSYTLGEDKSHPLHNKLQPELCSLGSELSIQALCLSPQINFMTTQGFPYTIYCLLTSSNLAKMRMTA